MDGMTRKRGKLSTYEEQYIERNVDKESIQEIALALNRTVETVQKYMDSHSLAGKDVSDDEKRRIRLEKQLAARPYFHQMSKQFTEEEVRYFVYSWVELMIQLNEDVLFSEEMDIKEWIRLDILMNGTLNKRKEVAAIYNETEKELDAAFSVPKETRDHDHINRLETRLNGCQKALDDYTGEHTKLLKEIDTIAKRLKTARSERVEQVENAAKNWFEYLRKLDDEKFRLKEGYDAEVMRMAKDAARDRLSKLHTYVDGSVEQPFLTPETVIIEELNDREEEHGEVEG